VSRTDPERWRPLDDCTSPAPAPGGKPAGAAGADAGGSPSTGATGPRTSRRGRKHRQRQDGPGLPEAVAGLDFQGRRAQGALTTAALGLPDHAHFLPTQGGGGKCDEAKEAAKSASG